jgi:hypothetical protein
LNLTDMWRAAGADPSKRPADWLRSQQAREFMAFLEDVGNSHLLEREAGNPRQGDGGATWAHWQLGMAFTARPRYAGRPVDPFTNLHVVGERAAARDNLPLTVVTFSRPFRLLNT